MCLLSHSVVHYSYRITAIVVLDAVEAGRNDGARFGGVIGLKQLWLAREINNESVAFIDVFDPALGISSDRDTSPSANGISLLILIRRMIFLPD